jgi:phosphatidylserine/phosphatidylglycerophosphate/cardiolipin synthase-like enzyme
LTTDDDCRGDRLADAKVTRGPLVQKNLLAEPTPLDLALPQRALTLYSPRDEKTKLVTLDWYAQLMGSAQRIMCMTFAFNLDKVFQDVLVKPGKTLRYAVFDKPIDVNVEAEIGAVGSTVIAAGSLLDAGDLENFIGEKLTGFNRNLYIHDKFMVVDPLGNSPVIVTGSANFSEASTRTNDENMVVIEGDTRVADMYLGEYIRLYSHYAFREAVRIFLDRNPHAKPADMTQGFLVEDGDWTKTYFDPKDRSARMARRVYFAG